MIVDNRRLEVEICISSDTEDFVESVTAAYHGGADRIELCASMLWGGLTPTPAQMRTARSHFPHENGLLVMIRPREGDFCYSFQETEQMRIQVRQAWEAGADGVVFGFLTREGLVDLKTTEEFVLLAHELGMKTTFHRAFDVTPDPLSSLENLISCRVDRILTSGTAWEGGSSIIEGLPVIRQLIDKAAGCIEIVLGGGVDALRAEKALRVLEANGNRVSVHAFSGVRSEGKTDRDLVAHLVRSSLAGYSKNTK